MNVNNLKFATMETIYFSQFAIKAFNILLFRSIKQVNYCCEEYLLLDD